MLAAISQSGCQGTRHAPPFPEHYCLRTARLTPGTPQLPAALRRLGETVKFEGLEEEWRSKQRRTRPCIQRKLDAQASAKRRAQRLFRSQINAILRRKEKCACTLLAVLQRASHQRTELCRCAGAFSKLERSTRARQREDRAGQRVLLEREQVVVTTRHWTPCSRVLQALTGTTEQVLVELYSYQVLLLPSRLFLTSQPQAMI